MKRSKRIIICFLLTLACLCILFFAAVNTGSLEVTPLQLLKGLFIEYDKTVATVYDLRLPRIFIAMLAGAGIAVSGVLFQAVLQNSLADPGIIGISGGAGFFSALAVLLFPTLFMLTPLFACLGGTIAFALVYTISWKDGLSPVRIILVGIAVSAMFEGLVEVLNNMNGQNVSQVASIVDGNISIKTWSDVKLLAVFTFFGLIGAMIVSERCNLLSLEEKTIQALGIRVNIVRLYISVIAVLLICVCTTITGVIGFLGLIVPHFGRILVGKDHRILIPYTIMLGAFTYLGADTLGRAVAYPYEISAAVIMAVIGGPCFIFLLRRSKQS